MVRSGVTEKTDEETGSRSEVHAKRTEIPPNTPRDHRKELSPVPPMPSWDLQNYEVEEVQPPRGRQMDWTWVPGAHGALQPGQDDRGAGSRQEGAERGASSRQEQREGDPMGRDGAQYLYERTQSLESQFAEMKSWQEQVSELKELLEKQQRTSEQRWSGYFSTPVHS